MKRKAIEDSAQNYENRQKRRNAIRQFGVVPTLTEQAFLSGLSENQRTKLQVLLQEEDFPKWFQGWSCDRCIDVPYVLVHTSAHLLWPLFKSQYQYYCMKYFVMHHTWKEIEHFNQEWAKLEEKQCFHIPSIENNETVRPSFTGFLFGNKVVCPWNFVEEHLDIFIRMNKVNFFEHIHSKIPFYRGLHLHLFNLLKQRKVTHRFPLFHAKFKKWYDRENSRKQEQWQFFESHRCQAMKLIGHLFVSSSFVPNQEEIISLRSSGWIERNGNEFRLDSIKKFGKETYYVFSPKEGRNDNYLFAMELSFAADMLFARLPICLAVYLSSFVGTFLPDCYFRGILPSLINPF